MDSSAGSAAVAVVLQGASRLASGRGCLQVFLPPSFPPSLFPSLPPPPPSLSPLCTAVGACMRLPPPLRRPTRHAPRLPPPPPHPLLHLHTPSFPQPGTRACPGYLMQLNLQVASELCRVMALPAANRGGGRARGAGAGEGGGGFEERGEGGGEGGFEERSDDWLARQLRVVVSAYAHVIHGERGTLVQGLALIRALCKSSPGALARSSNPASPTTTSLPSPSSTSLSSSVASAAGGGRGGGAARDMDPLEAALSAYLKAVLLCTRGGGAASSGAG